MFRYPAAWRHIPLGTGKLKNMKFKVSHFGVKKRPTKFPQTLFLLYRDPATMSLGHPGWGDFVFSLFPPPQQLLPLTLTPFVPDLRYFGQRKYRSGEIYWMTFL